MSCPSGKKRFANEDQADTVLGRIWNTVKPGRRLESRYYECDLCAGYHLTSHAPREEPA